jgi:hypothetical protein
LKLAIREPLKDAMNAILPEGLYFSHFLEANLKIILIKWLSRFSGTSRQKVKSQINSASSATRAQRAVKIYKPPADLVITAFEYKSNLSK